MSGFSAIYSYQADAATVDSAELLATREAMAPRGPDGAGSWMNGDRCVGLTHRRLAILDLTDAGAQPMATPDGRLHIVFNGEIYNYRELRETLQGCGHCFASDSDTEALLYAYREYGQAMVERLRGMFAFAIWDVDRRGLFLARDHFGIKPLYYHDDGKIFRCASQVKALLAGGQIETLPEPAGQVGFFLWGCVPDPYTLYRNLFALPAGHTLWVDNCGPRVPRRYFDVSEELASVGPPEGARPVEEVLRETLQDSVAHHLIAHVPVGMLLSSGLDSAVLTALAAECTIADGSAPATSCGNRIRTFTLGFSEYAGTPEDEVPLAQRVARHYRCYHDVSTISRKDFDEDLPAIFRAMDQPTIDGVNTWFVARQAVKSGLKVAISGLGGDELLGRYSSFTQIPQLVRRVRPFTRLPGLGRGLRMVSAPVLKRFTSPKYASLFEYGGSYGGAYLLRRGLFMPWELPAILDGDLVREGWATLQPVVRIDEWLQRVPTVHAKIAALEMNLYMRHQLLRDTDWAGMAHSLEIRVPFVDVSVLRALAPYLARVDGQAAKRPLGVLPVNPLPSEIVNRTKTGFSIPVQDWGAAATDEPPQRGLRGWATKVHREQLGILPPEVDSRRIFALVLDAFGGRGGIAKFNRDLLWALAGFPEIAQVVAVPRYMSEPLDGIPAKLRYNLTGLNGKVAYALATWRAMRSTTSVELVLCGHINLLPFAWALSRTSGAPLYCIIHGIEVWRPRNNPFIKKMLRSLEGVIAVSELTRRRFASWSGVPLGKISLLFNTFDPQVFYPSPKSEVLLDRYGLRDKTVLLTVGRLVSRERCKGFDEVLEMLPDLAKEISNVVYLIGGDGSDRERLQAKARFLGVGNRVVFAGYIDEFEKVDHYRLADVYVMPSRGEGFGIVFLEAMACGIPAIGSKVDGSREALQNGNLGALVDPRQPLELFDAVRAALRIGVRKPPTDLEDFSLTCLKRQVTKIFFERSGR